MEYRSQTDGSNSTSAPHENSRPQSRTSTAKPTVLPAAQGRRSQSPLSNHKRTALSPSESQSLCNQKRTKSPTSGYLGTISQPTSSILNQLPCPPLGNSALVSSQATSLPGYKDLLESCINAELAEIAGFSGARVDADLNLARIDDSHNGTQPNVVSKIKNLDHVPLPFDPPTSTSTHALFVVPESGKWFDTSDTFDNFKDFTNDFDEEMAPLGENFQDYDGFNNAHGYENQVTQGQNHVGTVVQQQQQYHQQQQQQQQGSIVDLPLHPIPSSGGGVSQTLSNFSPSLHTHNTFPQNPYQPTVASSDTTPTMDLTGTQLIQDTQYPKMLSPTPRTAFVRPEYVNLETNRIAEPGPIAHPDKNFRPYGTNNWHVILHDHTRLRYLSNSEIKEIRDHVGELNTFIFSQEPVPQGKSQEQFAHVAEGEPNKKPRLIDGGPYNTEDATQVWKYCHAYLGRRGQMRNNNAARRSRMKKESETRYWKLLALQAGVPDHEYDFTEAEEIAAFARAEDEKTEKEQQQQAQAAAAAATTSGNGSQRNPRKRKATTATGGDGGRGQKAAMRGSTASGSAAGSPTHNLPIYSFPGHDSLGGGQKPQYYQGYAPALAPAPQQSFYGQYQQGSPVQYAGSLQPPHRFNTRSRARAEQSRAAPVAPMADNISYEDFALAGAAPMTTSVGYETFDAINATSPSLSPNTTVSPSDLQLQPNGESAAQGTADPQADGNIQEISNSWMDFYLNMP